MVSVASGYSDTDILILGLVKPISARHPVKIEKDTDDETDAIVRWGATHASAGSDRVCFDRRWDLRCCSTRIQC